jgi:radical SAM protein (TIGR04043 family)
VVKNETPSRERDARSVGREAAQSNAPSERLQVELQSYGLRLENRDAGAAGRQGGAGPSDHKAVRVDGSTLMVPIFNEQSEHSPYFATDAGATGASQLFRNGEHVGTVTFPRPPQFYRHATSDGVPMWKVAKLHSHNVLATTVLQRCIRYDDRETACQFCAIGQSLAAERTIAYKQPHHLAETARVAADRDGVEQFVMTTGTPNTSDRGARLLHESAAAVQSEVPDLAIQVQCEPPDDFAWFARLKDAGADALGMHMEAVEPHVREQIMPGKAQVPVSYYMDAFEEAVAVFGRGNVSTYLLAGLGDSQEALVATSQKLIDRGVYPFIVPFVPITGTPLEHHSAPDEAFMEAVLAPVGEMLVEAGLTSDTLSAGCAKCGACSTLKFFEEKARKQRAV